MLKVDSSRLTGLTPIQKVGLLERLSGTHVESHQVDFESESSGLGGMTDDELDAANVEHVGVENGSL